MARLSPEVLGLAEAGYVIEDFATAEGNRVPVTVEDETPLYVAGTAALADESLGEIADERVAETGEGGWKNVVGHAQMRSENDVGKEIYVKSINPGRWIGPLGVVMAFPSDQIYEKVQNKQVVALDKEVGKRIGLLKYGQAKEVEVSWGGPPDDGMGPAQEAGSPEMHLDTTGGRGIRATSFSSGRRPSVSDAFSLRGASVGSAARMSGVSEAAVSNELEGRVDMDVGRDLVGGAIAQTKGERAAWVMAAMAESKPSITMPDMDWSGLPQVIGGYNYNWDDYYNQYGGGGYDDPYGGEIPPTIQTAAEQALATPDTSGRTYRGPEGTYEHWASDWMEGKTQESYLAWVLIRQGSEWGIDPSGDPRTQQMLQRYSELYYDENGKELSDEELLNSEAYQTFMDTYQGQDEEILSVASDLERTEEDIAAWRDPYDEGVRWETEKGKEVKGMPGITVGELFGGDWRKWQEERAQTWAGSGSHDTYVQQVSQQGPAAVVSQPTPWTEKKIEAYGHGLTADEWKRSWDYQEERRQEESGTDALNVHGLTADEWERSWDNPNRKT